jgi:hypothetical protein
MNRNSTKLKRQYPSVPFCGLAVLIRRLSSLSMRKMDVHTNNEIVEVGEELHRLDSSLHRLRHERSLVDEQDIDLAIDRLRGTHQGGGR